MKAASRLVLMYLLLAGSLGLVSLYVGCTEMHRKALPASMAAERKLDHVLETPEVTAAVSVPVPASAAASAPLTGTIGGAAAPMEFSAPAPAPVPPVRYNPDFNTDSFEHPQDNPFMKVDQNPLSTFSVDVDTASYAIMRRFLNEGQLPPRGAVRIEELVNYFAYDYPQPKNGAPFSINLEAARCPWNDKHQLVRIGLKGREIRANHRPQSNLVFLLDVSGSMSDPNKLPLVKRSMQMMLDKLDGRDRVAIVVYAGTSGLAIPSTRCNDAGKAEINRVIENLSAGGSTQGSAGVQLAYEVASANFMKNGTNRVILCTDGDFNVGVTSQSELVDLIGRKAQSGVYLTVLGFGMGNLKDSTMEQLADKGNGNYGYIDTINEARRILVESLNGTLVTIAKDVKIQVEFNPAEVAAYRLIGYEDRMLAKEDFNNDKKDAGEIGAGHTVTALYEIVPAGQPVEEVGAVDPLKYQKPSKPSHAAQKGELLTVKLRYKSPKGGSESKLVSEVLRAGEKSFEQASPDFRFAAAVASFGMILRESPDRGKSKLEDVVRTALAAKGADEYSTRAEFVTLARLAGEIKGKQ